MNVFLSYAHDDDPEYKDEFLKQLSHLNRLGGISFWHDGHIGIGHNWREEIEEKLGQADAAVLLVSNLFLGSEFCYDVEVQKLLRRHKEEGINIYPIAIEVSNWNLYDWLSELNLGPKDKNGNVRPLSEMSSPDRKTFYVKLAEQIYNDLARRLARETPKGRQLNSTQKREQYARRLASKFPSAHDETIKELTESYILFYQRGLDKPAFDLVNAFDRALTEAGHKVTDDHHQDLLTLLRAGLPVYPTHLKGLSSLDAESLVSNPGYPALMLGIRLTENDHKAALNHLQKVGQSRNYFDCALIAYALGQCHRKLGHLNEARAMHDLALLRIGEWKSEHCKCGPKCLKDGLLVEIHRGLGAVFRKLGKLREAEEHFESARRHLTDQVSPTVRSDFLYSYGYYVYERAIKAKMQEKIEQGAYQEHLRQAKEMFKESRDLRQLWDAPRSRLQIVKQLLGENDENNDYLMPRNCALSERGSEPRLTAAMCGFAILINELEEKIHPTSELNSQTLYKELEQVFQTQLVSYGARVCHAFDTRVIRHIPKLRIDQGMRDDRDLRDLSADPWLLRVYELFQDSEDWKSQTLPEQQTSLENFRRKCPSPKSSSKKK